MACEGAGSSAQQLAAGGQLCACRARVPFALRVDSALLDSRCFRRFRCVTALCAARAIERKRRRLSRAGAGGVQARRAFTSTVDAASLRTSPAAATLSHHTRGRAWSEGGLAQPERGCSGVALFGCNGDGRRAFLCMLHAWSPRDRPSPDAATRVPSETRNLNLLDKAPGGRGAGPSRLVWAPGGARRPAAAATSRRAIHFATSSEFPTTILILLAQ